MSILDSAVQMLTGFRKSAAGNCTRAIFGAAVASLIAAPAVARAEEASPSAPTEPSHKLEVYGLLIPAIEYASSTGADDSEVVPMRGPSTRGGSFSGAYTNHPASQAPRGRTISAPSHVGIRGRWELPSGHYSRFQWEFGSLTFGGTLPVTMYSPGLGIMSRNSALFLGGFWGEIGFGIWDTPFASVGNYAPAYAPLVNASTLMSSSILGGMPFANGAVAGFPAQNFCFVEVDNRTSLSFQVANLADLTQCANNAMNFDRREANSIIYQSPTLYGFALREHAAVNFRRSSGFETVERNPWLSSTNLTFSKSGFFAGLGFELRRDYVADAAQFARGITLGGSFGTTQAQWSAGATGIDRSREQGLRLNLRYTTPFGLTLGVLVEQLEFFAHYNTPIDGDIVALRKRAARVELIYQHGGHTIGGAFHKALPLTAELSGPNTFNADGSAGKGVTAAYAYNISKAVSASLYFMTIINELNARYNVVFQGLPSAAGADLLAFGTGLRYAF